MESKIFLRLAFKYAGSRRLIEKKFVSENYQKYLTSAKDK